MPTKRLLALPPLALIVVLAYSFAVPSRRSAGQAPEPAADNSITPTSSAGPAATSAAIVADPPVVPGLPTGLTGELTYRTEHEAVTVAFPSAAAVAHGPMPAVDAGTSSADGLWSATVDCLPGCQIALTRSDGEEHTLRLPFVSSFRWSPDGHRLAFTRNGGGYPTSDTLMLLDDPDGAEPRSLYVTRGGDVHPLEWLSSGDLLIADNSEADAHLVRVTVDGEAATVATVPSAIWYLYPSPDRSTVAFTQDSPSGWQLWTVDAATGDVRNAGNMGSDPAGMAPPIENARVREKGPMYIAWSPDGARIAFGGGYEPPYMMTTADLATGAKHRTEFPDGYPGEIKWSPDGTLVAVSSYNLPRTHHESFVVDPETGVARDILSGCVIVWSPDSRFLAIHDEREPGVAIADVVTLEHAQLTHTVNDTPLKWDP